MATSDNYLKSIKCWLKLHSNLKEGNETEDWKSDKASVSAGCHCHSPQAPCWGCSHPAYWGLAGVGAQSLHRDREWPALVNCKEGSPNCRD